MTDADNPPPAKPPQHEPASPLAHRTPLEGATSLRELPWCGKINLRGDPDNAQFLSAAGEALKVPLPLAANTTAGGDDAVVFWLGPDEWLLHCEIERTGALLGQLAQNLAQLDHAATEVTDYYTVLELRGEAAAAALARGCPLDLHDRRFKASHCAQSRFGNASVLLYKPGGDPAFQIQVRWSFAAYLWDYLASVIDSL